MRQWHAKARILLVALFGVFSAALCIRLFVPGGITHPISVRSPLNVESFVALSFLLLLVLGTRRQQPISPALPFKPRALCWLAVASLVLLCVASFGWSLSTPFLFDSYGHITEASQRTWSTISHFFFKRYTDTAFRPVTFLAYFLNFKWAQFQPLRWHSWSLGIHIINCVLIFALARKLGFSPFASLFAGALFAIHGTRTESVCWVDAHFDLLATLFVLLALLSFLRYASNTRTLWLITALICSLLSFASKESSFSLPFLLLTLLPLCAESVRRRLLRTAPIVFVAAIVVFAYRWWMIGGIGGYKTNGYPDILNLNIVHLVKGFFWRLWALLFFPINWEAGMDRWLCAAAVIYLVILLLTAAKTRITGRALLASVTFIWAAVLPVSHLLLIGSNLAGARFLYLALGGFALLWAAITDALKERIWRYSIAAVVLLFNLAALHHNTSAWRDVAQTAQHICQNFGKQILHTTGPVVVVNVPEQYRGVYFLRNGFPQCVQLNSGVSAGRIIVQNHLQAFPGAAQSFIWDNKSMSFRPVRAAPE